MLAAVGGGRAQGGGGSLQLPGRADVERAIAHGCGRIGGEVDGGGVERGEIGVGEQVDGAHHREGGHADGLEALGELGGVLPAGPGGDCFVERVLIAQAVQRALPARVVERAAGQIAEARPLVVAAHDDCQPGVVAGCGVDAVGGESGGAVALGAGVAPVEQVVHERLGGALEGCFALGEVDELALAGALAVFERGEHGDEGVAGGGGVEVGGVFARLRVAGVAEQAFESVEGGERGAVGDEVAPRAGGRAGGGEGGHDEARVDGAEGGVVEPERGHDAGREVVEDDVGDGDQPLVEGDAAWVAEVDGDAEFAAVEPVEGARVVGRGGAAVAAERADGRLPPAHRDARLSVRRADFDHFGAEVGQHHAEQRAGPDVAVVDDADVVEWGHLGAIPLRLSGLQPNARVAGLGRRASFAAPSALLGD